MAKSRQKGRNSKMEDLDVNREDFTVQYSTTDQGLRIKAGERGSALLEDFILREKITHFDHERIPERVVHARGAAAHGHFQVYKSFVSPQWPALFDAVFVPGGDTSVNTLSAEPRAVEFVAEAYTHCKAIGATGEGMALLEAAGISANDRELPRKGRKPSGSQGIAIGNDASMNGVAREFIEAVAQHRHWGRERQE